MVASAEKDARDLNGIPLLKAEERIETLRESLKFQSADPRSISFDRLAAHIHAPTGDHPVEDRYRAAIHNRSTAIRAYCVKCQGGMPALVRLCESCTCPLYSFRDGKDYFRGYALPKIAEDDEEDDLLFTDED